MWRLRNNSMKNIIFFKIISSTLLVGLFILFAYGSGSDSEEVKVDINDTKAIESYLQGKWHWEKYSGNANETWKYRFEIVGNQLKIWSCIGNIDDPFDMNMEGNPKIHEFNLGQPSRDVDGYNCRYLEFDEGNVSLTYRAISPIWFVSDENWDTPVIRSASGTPSWTRGW